MAHPEWAAFTATTPPTPTLRPAPQSASDVAAATMVVVGGRKGAAWSALSSISSPATPPLPTTLPTATAGSSS